MQVSLFDFLLPPERIAQAPASARDGARLLHVAEGLADRAIRDLPDLLKPDDLLVFNDSKVIPARLFAPVGEKPVEILLHKPIPPVGEGEDARWLCFARPARRLKEGMALVFAPDFRATVEGRNQDGHVILRFAGSDLMAQLERYGHMPLPPYIARADAAADKTRYQTVYATHPGSVAAPTAGLHFSESLLAQIAARGVESARVTLHVGAGTFQPVKAEHTASHVMHHEWINVPEATVMAVARTKAAGGRVVAVGTTSLRALEAAAQRSNTLAPFSGETDIFITPGYRFRVVDRLITNFHLPRSTLFMLVSAFSGRERMQAAYAHAIAQQYRFYSYGDACLLEKMPDV